MTRIIVAGSRDFNNIVLFSSAMSALLSDISAKEVEIISGGCRGADSMGEEYARKHGITLKKFNADWEKYGKAAGPIRNREMARYASQADRGILIAFPVGESRGTRSMIRLARDFMLETYIYNN